ncbi:MAG: peptidoglycan-binding domain-containing protein, partial [Carbonactinosporaceae bacterium]
MTERLGLVATESGYPGPRTGQAGDPGARRRTRAGLLTATLLAVATVLSAPVQATAASTWTMQDRFARETVRQGDEDTSTYAIEHVTELQRRLHRAGSYDGPVTGYFGSLTKAAVERFQRAVNLPVSGVATHATWERLIPRSTRLWRAPDVCKTDGWHACYNRTRHEVMLFHNGTLWNAWLVRGGASDTPTRRGRHHVYYRDVDHVSSQFGSPMPYSQFFDRGQALHGSRAMMDPYHGHS